mgnify:FL=1
MNFKRYILLYTIIPMLILAVSASYFRFMVSQDYLVTYEGFCDPYTESCFIYCEDETCTDPFYSTSITRKAAAVFSVCGEDITDCEAADVCTDNETECSVLYCDPILDIDACEMLSLTDLE